MRVLRQVQQDTRSHYVAPYDDPQVIAGQGTVALEMLQELPALDALIIPVGGGGLLGGMAMTAKSMKPSIRVYGAEPVGADDAHRSLIAGKPLPMHHPQTIADGLLTSLGDWTWPLIQSHVDDILTVSDSEITGAMTLLWSRMKQVVEPSGAVALAVALTEGFQSRHQSQRIGVVLSGGNVDLSFFHRHKQP
jgi:threonine dehydratase